MIVELWMGNNLVISDTPFLAGPSIQNQYNAANIVFASDMFECKVRYGRVCCWRRSQRSRA